MHRILFLKILPGLLLCGLGICHRVLSQEPAAPEKLPLWAGEAPIGEGKTAPSTATLTLYRPANPNGTAIVICPGGGYGGLAIEPEGHGIAKWLNKHGITGIVLQYRLPQGNHHLPILDAQQAIRTVRAKAADWKISPDRIGIIGFSAGGHLAATAATQFDAGDASSTDPIAKFSSRPDFAILIYPVISMGAIGHAGSRQNLLGKTPPEDLILKYSCEKQVTEKTPRCYIAHPVNDRIVPVENSRQFATALKSKGVPCEYLELPSGDHGLNGYKGPMWDAWQDGVLKWLK
jgi:acetyl esterase/lipase